MKSKLPASSVVTVKSSCHMGIAPYLRQISTVARRIGDWPPFPSAKVNVAFTRSADAIPGATDAPAKTIPTTTVSRANRESPPMHLPASPKKTLELAARHVLHSGRTPSQLSSSRA